MIKHISVLKNAFFLSIACKLLQNSGGICIPCMFLLLSSYLENLCIAQKFKRLVSDSMLSSCWGDIFYRPLLTDIVGYDCATIFLHIPYVLIES